MKNVGCLTLCSRLPCRNASYVVVKLTQLSDQISADAGAAWALTVHIVGCFLTSNVMLSCWCFTTSKIVDDKKGAQRQENRKRLRGPKSVGDSAVTKLLMTRIIKSLYIAPCSIRLSRLRTWSVVRRGQQPSYLAGTQSARLWGEEKGMITLTEKAFMVVLGLSEWISIP